MPERRLGRDERDMFCLPLHTFEDALQGAHLDRIPQRSTGSVHARDVDGRDVSDGRPDDGLLRGSARRGQPRAPAVLVDRCAYHSDRHLACRRGLVELVAHLEDGGPLGPTVSVGALVERLAPSVCREHCAGTQHGTRLVTHWQIDAAQNAMLARAGVGPARERLEKDTKGDERARARRVDREAPAPEIKVVGNPPGARARGSGRRHESIALANQAVGGIQDVPGVLEATDAHGDRRLGDALAAHLHDLHQQDAMLRIHQR